MDCTGTIHNIAKDYITNKYQVTFAINEPNVINDINAMQDCEKLSIKVNKFRDKRSLDANGLLWHCLGKMAEALRTDKWSVYLQMLKRYGQFTYICVKEKAVDMVRAQWRECEVVGEIDINGKKAIQMLCYFGSSTYNSKEFSILLDGVISEMEEMGLETPTSSELQRVIDLYENSNSRQ